MATPKHRSSKTRKNIRNSSKISYISTRKYNLNEMAIYNLLVINNELGLGKYNNIINNKLKII